MNPLAKAYCRIYQTCFRIALPILPYRNPEQLNGIEEIPAILHSKHVQSLLLVADGGVRRLGLTQPLEEHLEEAGITCHVYEQNRPNPTIDDVEQAVLVYREGKANAIIAIGGGSAMDCAKAAGARIARPHLPVSKMKGILKILLPTPLMIAIPTTAGTGSEATLAAVITDAKTHHKYPINDFPLIPDYAVLDPTLTLGLPPFITATTGLDALTHAVEAYIGRSTNHFTRSMSEEAVTLIHRHLREAVFHGNNEVARAGMLRAAYCAGLAFTRSYVGYVHGVAHSLGGQYQTAHGLANAVILPRFLEIYGKSCEKKLAKLARISRVVTESCSDAQAARQFIDWIYDMNREFGLPDGFEEIREEDIPKMALHAAKESNPLYPVPKLMDAEELESVYRLLMVKEEPEEEKGRSRVGSTSAGKEEFRSAGKEEFTPASENTIKKESTYSLNKNLDKTMENIIKDGMKDLKTSHASIEDRVEAQRDFFQTGATLPLSYRHEALRKLKESIRRHENEINAALRSDLGKCPSETYMCETGMTLSELTFMDKHIDRWWRPHLVPSPLAQFHATSFTVRDPYGVVLIMSPWNYPFMLTMEPLIGAIACGNCCVVKPSAYSPSTSKVIAKIISECFPPEYVTVVEGGREENKTLLNQKFDYIFFTGGVNVGKEVMRHAAENLTPVTLELGGKSPVIVDSTANLKLAAKRLAFGKLLNCGQTCVAPDYLLIDRKVEKKFLSLLTKQIASMVGKKPLQNNDYVHMVNRKHFDRVMGLIDQSKVVLGGKGNTQTLRIQPTIMTGVTAEDKIMQEEIFGPVLPVITYDNIDEAFAFINERPHPLACYLFSDDKKIQKRYLRELPFGGGCINDTIIHLATSQMGFGGVGGSGMGSYHGRKSLETFSHEKSIVNKHTWLDLPMRYAPYHKVYDMLIRFFLR